MFSAINRDFLAELLAGSIENRRNRLEKDLGIHPERPVVNIFEVEIHPLVECRIVAAANLPETSKSRLHR